MTNEVKMQLPTGPLDMKEEEITSIEIMNPIEKGSTIDDKTLILDIKLLLNTKQIIIYGLLFL